MPLDFLHALLEPKALIAAIGTIGVIGIIFAETGLLIGFFLPGDSLLFTAGFLASQGYVSFAGLLIGTWVAAVIGDSVGYAFGKKIGPALFTKGDSVIFNKEHIARAQHFYEKYGAKTIVLGRFLPIVRTFAPVVAGIGNMNYKTFLTYNIIGGFIWTWSMLWLGYGLGALIPDPDKYVLPIVVAIIILSASPTLFQLFKKRS